METVIQGDVLVAGTAEGEILISSEPLSFWGGYDQHTGEIIDRRHPLSGEIAKGRILVLPGARGSSTTTAVLLEAIHLGNAPAAILIQGGDSFLALASIVADEMYATPIPIIALQPHDFAALHTGHFMKIFEDGTLEVYTSP